MLITLKFSDDGGNYVQRGINRIESYSCHIVDAIKQWANLTDCVTRDLQTPEKYYMDMITQVRHERFKNSPESVIFSRKMLRSEIEIKEGFQQGEVRLQLVQTGNRAEFKKGKIAGISVERLDWDERVETCSVILSHQKIIQAQSEFSFENEKDFPFITNKYDYQIYVLKRVTAIVLAEFAERIHLRAKKIAEKQEIDHVTTMKIIIAVRKRVRAILNDVEKALDEDFSDMFLLQFTD